MRVFDAKKVVPAPTYHIHLEVTEDEYKHMLHDHVHGRLDLVSLSSRNLISRIVSTVRNIQAGG